MKKRVLSRPLQTQKRAEISFRHCEAVASSILEVILIRMSEKLRQTAMCHTYKTDAAIQ